LLRATSADHAVNAALYPGLTTHCSDCEAVNAVLSCCCTKGDKIHKSKLWVWILSNCC